MMWERKELKERGKAAFKANYWKCVLVAILLALFVGGTTVTVRRTINNGTQQVNNYSVSTVTVGTNTSYIYNQQSYDPAQEAVTSYTEVGELSPEQVQALEEIKEAVNSPEFKQAVVAMVAAILGTLAVFGLIAALLRILVFNPLEVGCRGFFTRNTEAPAELSEVKGGFSPYGRTVGAMFLRDLFLCLWSMLFVIPGIIKSYSYRMVPYILADDPTISGRDAITLSRQMMDGQKWNTFVLDLSFIGWDILSILTAGLVGVFYVNPYKHSTSAELYQVLKNQ